MSLVPQARRSFSSSQNPLPQQGDHENDDADYLEGELAGQIRGVGVRSRIYWMWWMREEVRSWLMDYLQRVGAGGLTIFYYEQGNDASSVYWPFLCC